MNSIPKQLLAVCFEGVFVAFRLCEFPQHVLNNATANTLKKKKKSYKNVKVLISLLRKKMQPYSFVT